MKKSIFLLLSFCVFIIAACHKSDSHWTVWYSNMGVVSEWYSSPDGSKSMCGEVDGSRILTVDNDITVWHAYVLPKSSDGHNNGMMKFLGDEDSRKKAENDVESSTECSTQQIEPNQQESVPDVKKDKMDHTYYLVQWNELSTRSSYVDMAFLSPTGHGCKKIKDESGHRLSNILITISTISDKKVTVDNNSLGTIKTHEDGLLQTCIPIEHNKYSCTWYSSQKNLTRVDLSSSGMIWAVNMTEECVK